MSTRVQPRMPLDCSAKFIAYSLLSGFGSITERGRDATRLILGLLPSCMNGHRIVKVPMTEDTYTSAQLYLPELRVMASRHSYVHRGPLKNSKQAQAILSVIVSPLVFHLSSEERKQLLGSIDDIETLMSRPLDVLNELTAAWKIRHLELFTNWRSLPIAGVDEYHFGIKLPVPLALEDVLTPLPYPSKVPLTVWTVREKSSNRYAKLPPCDRRTLPRKPLDFRHTARPVPSRSAKESELKALDIQSRYFVLPELARTSSDTSSVSTDDCGFTSLSSDSDSPLLENEVFEEGTWDLVEDWSDFEPRCTCPGDRTCGAYAGCRSAGGRIRGEHFKNRQGIMSQWRTLLRRR